jgi:hypothetical protein
MMNNSFETFEFLELLSSFLNFGDDLFVFFFFGFMNKYTFGFWVLF